MILTSRTTASAAKYATYQMPPPFDWFPHMDRTLVNQGELLCVSTGKPHEYTMRSIVPNALAGASDVTKFGYMATGTINAGNNMLYRAMDVLRIQPYGQMTALGGRVPGRININTIQDKRVWDSWLDQQAWNGFTQADVTTMWTSMIGSRTPTMQARYTTYNTTPPVATGAVQLQDTGGASYTTPIPGTSVYDSTNGTRPPVPAVRSANLCEGYVCLRRRQRSLDRYPGSWRCDPDRFQLARQRAPLPADGRVAEDPQQHDDREPHVCRVGNHWLLRLQHSIAAGTQPVLGAEYYSTVPGDLRRKYFSVVDRTMVGLDASSIVAVR